MMIVSIFSRKYLVLGVFLFVFTIDAKKCYVPDSIKGVKITPQTLGQLAPEVPVQLKTHLNQLFAQPDTIALFDNLVAFPDVRAWSQKIAVNNALLSAAGYKNLSASGYAARMPGTDYLFKIAGQKDRLISMLATKGIVLAPEQQDDQPLSYYVDRYLDGALPTYQTASRMAYYLILKNRAQKKKYTHIRLPESYLVRLPGKSDGVEDGKVMLVQKVVPGSEMLAKNPERAAYLSKDVLKELVDAVISAGLWNIEKNILICNDDSVYVICNVDLVALAQQKNSSAKDFFHKSKERFDENVYIGLKGLLDLFKEDPKKVAYIKKRIKQDKRLKDSYYSVRLKELVK